MFWFLKILSYYLQKNKQLSNLPINVYRLTFQSVNNIDRVTIIDRLH